jgi:hypothetical protein
MPAQGGGTTLHDRLGRFMNVKGQSVGSGILRKMLPKCNRLVPPGSGEAGRRTEVGNESTMDYSQEHCRVIVPVLSLCT